MSCLTWEKWNTLHEPALAAESDNPKTDCMLCVMGWVYPNHRAPAVSVCSPLSYDRDQRLLSNRVPCHVTEARKPRSQSFTGNPVCHTFVTHRLAEKGLILSLWLEKGSVMPALAVGWQGWGINPRWVCCGKLQTIAGIREGWPLGRRLELREENQEKRSLVLLPAWNFESCFRSSFFP